jgi:hypothetical protein
MVTNPPAPARFTRMGSLNNNNERRWRMLVNAEDLPVKPTEYLVDGIIPRGRKAISIGFLRGQSYWGKSLLSNGELALAICNGTPFFGRKTVQGSVVLCLGEGQGDAGARKHARIAREDQDRIAQAAQIAVSEGDAAAKKWLDSLPPYTDEKLKVWLDPFTIPVTRVRSDGEGRITDSMQRFINAIKSSGDLDDLELVIIDSMSDFTGGLSIRNDTSANRFMLGLREMARQLKCAILVVAHPGNAERFYNAADFYIEIEPHPSTDPDAPKMAGVVYTKNKPGELAKADAYVIDKPHFWYEPILDDDGDPTGEVVLTSSVTISQIDPRDIPPSDNEPVELPDNTEPYALLGIANPNRGGRGQMGERTMVIAKYVNSRPEGTTPADIVNDLGEQLRIDNVRKAAVCLGRVALLGKIQRIEPGVYGPA